MRSSVVESETGRSKVDNIRTSSGMFLRRGQDDIISAVEQRIAEWTLLPVEHGEGLQVLRYNNGQKYDAVSVRVGNSPRLLLPFRDCKRFMCAEFVIISDIFRQENETHSL
jgi:hypothetical protein